jgi:hypothetical protein
VILVRVSDLQDASVFLQKFVIPFVARQVGGQSRCSIHKQEKMMGTEQDTEFTDVSENLDGMLDVLGAGMEDMAEAKEDQSKIEQYRTLKGLHGKIDETFTVKVVAGYGKITTAKKYTAGAHPKGTMTITQPEGGEWGLKVVDRQYPPPKYKPIIDAKGVKKGQSLDWDYKTGLKCQLEIEVRWSEKTDTALKIHLNATY